MNYIEILGYVAMILVSGSFLLKDIIKLRLVNLIGAICFIIYGLLISSFPVTGLNIFVACVNGYYIYQNIKTK
ncbi:MULTISPECIES: YgjV family protein [unclassified Lonepinella]|uniref:YgjV family protein n=1 Tax=unclassified Lonepinella TaxID=2642006 RepID=UPI0036DD86D9